MTTPVEEPPSAELVHNVPAGAVEVLDACVYETFRTADNLDAPTSADFAGDIVRHLLTRYDHPPHEECADGCGLDITHQGACLDKPGGRQICTHEPEPVDEMQTHFETICTEAGLGVMVQVLEIIRDRGEVKDDTLMALSAEDVSGFYWDTFGPAIDRIQNEMED